MTAATSPRARRPKNAVITPMDHAVLDAIGINGFLTFQELRTGPLHSVSREHSWRRLKTLCNEGLLREAIGDSGVILGWSLNNEAVARRIGGCGEGWHLEAKPPAYTTSFAHDQALRRVRMILCQSTAVRKWIPEHVLKAEAMRELQHFSMAARREPLGAIPDALLHLNVDGIPSKAALEVELTRKSKRRLYVKLQAYVTGHTFDCALFIVQGDRLLTALKEIYREVLDKSPFVKLSRNPNEIYFAALSEVLRDGLHAKFSTLTDSVTFAELGSRGSNDRITQ